MVLSSSGNILHGRVLLWCSREVVFTRREKQSACFQIASTDRQRQRDDTALFTHGEIELHLSSWRGEDREKSKDPSSYSAAATLLLQPRETPHFYIIHTQKRFSFLLVVNLRGMKYSYLLLRHCPCAPGQCFQWSGSSVSRHQKQNEPC